MSQTDNATPSSATTGLLLTGGGARAAYQVGVLQALAKLRRGAGAASRGPLFPIITGTSAGAINAAALACGADDFEATVRRIGQVWAGLGPDQIYSVDALRVLSMSGHVKAAIPKPMRTLDGYAQPPAMVNEITSLGRTMLRRFPMR